MYILHSIRAHTPIDSEHSLIFLRYPSYPFFVVTYRMYPFFSILRTRSIPRALSSFQIFLHHSQGVPNGVYKGNMPLLA